MRKLLSERVAATGILVILSAIIIFHLLIMAGVIPFGIVWGGRLKMHSEMLQFETVSILLNLAMVALVAVKTRLLKFTVKPAVLKVAFWLMAGLFALNTVGNLFSNNPLETLIFTPITFLLAVFCLRLALSNKPEFAAPAN